MINQVINGWWVLNHVSADRYNCQLTCGCIRTISGTDLRNGTTPTCKCKSNFTKRYVYLDIPLTIAELSKLSGLAKSTLRHRLEVMKWDVVKAMTTPLLANVNNKKRHESITEVTYNGSIYKLSELAIIYDVPYNTLRYRINSGWPVELAIQRNAKYRGRGGAKDHTAYDELTKYTVNEVEYSLEEISYKFKISSRTFLRRLGEGMTPDQAVTHNPWKTDMYEYREETNTLGYFAKKYGVNKATLHTRIKSGWSLEEALTRQPLPPKARRFGRIDVRLQPHV